MGTNHHQLLSPNEMRPNVIRLGLARITRSLFFFVSFSFSRKATHMHNATDLAWVALDTHFLLGKWCREYSFCSAGEPASERGIGCGGNTRTPIDEEEEAKKTLAAIFLCLGFLFFFGFDEMSLGHGV